MRLSLGASAYQVRSDRKDKAPRDQRRGNFAHLPYPSLVDVKGRFYPARICDLREMQFWR